MASEYGRIVPLAQWRDTWYRGRSKKPWQLYVSNLPVQNRIKVDKPAEAEIGPRGPCGGIEDPITYGQRLVVRAYPKLTKSSEGVMLPLCLINEVLTRDTVPPLLSTLLTIRQIFALDTLDSLCLLIHTVLWHHDWKTDQAGGTSILCRPYMDEEIDSLDGQAKFFVALHAPCSTIETLLGFWNTIGLRGANAYLKAEANPDRKITYTEIPPRLLSETETQLVYGLPAEESPKCCIRNEGQLYYIEYANKHIYLKNTKGVRMLSHLLANPLQVFSATELRTAVDGHRVIPNQVKADYDPDSDLSVGPELMQAESALDEKAHGDIERVIKRLAKEMQDDEESGKLDLASDKDAEMHELLSYVKKSRSTKRRARRTTDPQLERDRKAIWSNLQKTRNKIDSTHPELAKHLNKCLVDGNNCFYDPNLGS